MKIRPLTKSEVQFTVSIEPEDIDVRGNYMCTDDGEADKAAEDEIIRRLNNEETEAWCVVVVKAKWKTYEAFASLGGCSFEPSNLQSEIEMYADDLGMFEEALERLNDALQSEAETLGELST
jgi:hypothetical protein